MVDFICEAKYIAALDAAKEAVWLWKFISELEVTLFIDGLVLLYCDSSSAIAQAKEPKSYHCTKHVLCCYHLMRAIMNRGDIELQNIDGKKILADPFTKALRIKEVDDFK